MTTLALDLGELLTGIPRGAWVAIARDLARVLAYGSNLAEAVAEGNAKCEQDPVVTKVPLWGQSIQTVPDAPHAGFYDLFRRQFGTPPPKGRLLFSRDPLFVRV